MTNNSATLQITDVVDFYARWPELRRRILAMIEGQALTSTDIEILRWLVTVVDMVGPADLEK